MMASLIIQDLLTKRLTAGWLLEQGTTGVYHLCLLLLYGFLLPDAPENGLVSATVLVVFMICDSRVGNKDQENIF